MKLLKRLWQSRQPQQVDPPELNAWKLSIELYDLKQRVAELEHVCYCLITGQEPPKHLKFPRPMGVK